MRLWRYIILLLEALKGKTFSRMMPIADRDNFLERLQNILTDSNTSCFAWALIPNHFSFAFTNRQGFNINSDEKTSDRSCNVFQSQT